MDGLAQALARQRIARVCVVSPHLDDAVFSVAEFLRAAGLPPREVYTVFTAARADSDAQHTLAMGFSDPLREFEARRQEDIDAMTLLGLDFEHAGAEVDRFTPQVAESTVARILARAALAQVPNERLLVLLPAGAGATLGAAQRLWRRIRLQPFGCPPHAEHEWVRDGLLSRFVSAGVQVGLYAEIPYLWAEPIEALLGRVRCLIPQPFSAFRLPTDPTWKLRAVRCYRSQYRSEFGRKVGYQQRTLAMPEAILLPFR
jgi:LmbE family N-acetylglucosaminyl deacetylase